ncbi:C4-dicarboxylate ABC transporter permease [Brevirhabdus pacifica]|uniref:C4-dicarboxylate ABC transporter permease n=1 Tax=Brevirhabdus pacifica TaxID=1267768 RepID=A0A1U7DKC8_9RHOB|nr:tripartite tricarboxylate transporter permease [Brevirhabdus pacifica]APX90477.1 C4-dicarboxylate ABC transporter permease [Brevirhabdus pacifica]OWU78508.1 C4-dicarboxylate ABC transporter permease [Loktanella sp. 22II-4b]PJJ85419.1 putative tricarboxylic transport membrane protein [Brevirhabdus pacifica]
MDSFLAALAGFGDPYLVGVVIFGTLGGVLVGAMPGLSSTMATALLLPFTLTMDPIAAIALLSALYCAGTFGGSITAILVNAPGAPPAAATAFDGYPLAQKGYAGKALGMAAVSSVIGGIFSIIVLIVAAPLLSRVAYSFGPPEYFALAVFGLSMLATISGESALKNLIGGALGVLVATVGMDFTTGIERFTFGNWELSEGIGFIPVMIGLFAGAEFIKQSGKLNLKKVAVPINAVKLPTRQDIRFCLGTIARSCGIGSFIGLLPAEGGTVAAMMGYAEAKRFAKDKSEFGKGDLRGIAGPEAANNAATGAAMVPTLALGIPGSATTAIILGALMVHGLRPGPHLFTEQPTLLYSIFLAMLIANFAFAAFGFVGAKFFARITLIPTTYLWPAVFVLACIGAYALEQALLDVWIMISAAVLGFVMQRFGFSAAPVIMGLILGELVEGTLKQSLIIFDHSWLGFLERPIVVTFLALTLLSMSLPVIAQYRARRRRLASQS